MSVPVQPDNFGQAMLLVLVLGVAIYRAVKAWRGDAPKLPYE